MGGSVFSQKSAALSKMGNGGVGRLQGPHNSQAMPCILLAQNDDGGENGQYVLVTYTM